MKRSVRHLDIYAELCPASSATVIGAGLITITMGSAPTGLAFLLAGIAVGVAGPVAKTLQEHRSRKKLF